MGIASFFRSARRIIRTANKPGRKELWISIKMSLLIIALVGSIAFIVKYVSSILQATP
ncbi:MAG: preprotein translocase subunit SecE [Candidatus Bathyarchaeia archaeon]